jgi:hypothetical protein
MPNIADVVADEAFGVTALTESFMSVDHVLTAPVSSSFRAPAKESTWTPPP